MGIWGLVVTLPNWTPIFKWYIARFVVNIDTEIKTLHNEIGLCVQKRDTILKIDGERDWN